MRRAVARTPVIPAALAAALVAALLPPGAAEARGGRGARLFRASASPAAPVPAVAGPAMAGPVLPGRPGVPVARLGTAVALALPFTPRPERAAAGARIPAEGPSPAAAPALRLGAAEATGSLPEGASPQGASPQGGLSQARAAPPPVAPARAWCEAGRVVGSGAGFCLVN